MPTPWLALVLSRLSHTSSRRPWLCPWPDVSRLLSARLAVERLEDRTTPAVFTVTNTLDSGIGSLRQAILDANAATGADAIQFAIGTGAQTIAPSSALPAITGAVTLDGTTQPGYSGVPLIELRGDSAGSGADGLSLATGSDGSTVRGLVINRFAGDGIQIVSSSNVIVGNFIGTDGTGAAALGNAGHGVLITGGAQFNRVGTDGDGVNDAAERNVISANTRAGVDIWAAHKNVVAGNYLGTDATGTAALGNGWEGVRIELGGQSNRIGTNADGVADAAERNVIAGNKLGGVRLYAVGTTLNVVAGNYIGTNAAGTVALGNVLDGVTIDGAASNTIGGSAAGTGNVISGNKNNGVSVAGGSTGNRVQGNFIGTNAAGAAAIGNANYGVQIPGSTNGNIIGTDGDGVGDAGEGNVISGNGSGVQIGGGSANNVVAGNLIGLTADGMAALGNAGGMGVWIVSGADNNRIGTNADGVSDDLERNVISANGTYGVEIGDAGTTGNVVAGNYIGTNAAGTAALGNASHGVFIRRGATNNRVGTNADGVNDAAERNVISGNLDGVAVGDGPSTGNVVAGNYIGTNAAGAATIGNRSHGVYIDSANNTVGGTATGAGNLVSGNAQFGIYLVGTGANNNLVRGNTVGLAADGTTPVPNGWWGAFIERGSNNVVGGTTPGAGNLISGNAQGGVAVIFGQAAGNVIQGNLIGTDVTGMLDRGNAFQGVYVGNWGQPAQGGPGNTLIGGSSAAARNVISGNNNNGVLVEGAAGTVIAGNYVGLNAAGTAAVANSQRGVFVFAGATNTRIGTDGDGIADAAERNVISGNAQDGVSISGIGTTGNVVAGNYLGTSAGGTTKVANGWYGVALWGGTTGNRVGTDGDGIADAAERNVISGNSISGVYIVDLGTTGNVVAGNYIGTNATGGAAVGNAVDGVSVWAGAANNRIGTAGDGTADAAERNVISGNASNGIRVFGAGTTGTVIAGNYVGLNAAGTATVANSQRGVLVDSGATNTRIGTDGDGIADAAERNVISGNAGENIWIDGAGTNDTVIAGNYVGLNAAGTAAVTNGGGAGMAVNNGPKRTRIGTNADGLSDDLERNVISGNRAEGLFIAGPGTELTVVAGNYVGLNAAGTAAVPNLAISGIQIRTAATNNLIGTNADGVRDNAERNVISGNAGDGICITGAGTDNNVVAGNYIGTDVNGNTLIPGTVSWWKGENDAADSADGNTGALLNGVSFTPGVVGQAFSFDGVNDYVRVAANSNMPSGNASRTIEGWVYTRASSWQDTRHTVFHSGTASVRQSFGLDMHLYPQMEFYSWGDDFRFNAGVPQEGWVHFAITYDGLTVRAYTQGQLRGSRTYSSGLNTTLTALEIGTFAGLGAYFDGLIDDFTVYNRALTATEVQAIYSSNSAIKAGDLGNKSHGVRVTNGAANNTVGGDSAAAGNVIAGNAGDGVNLASDLSAYGSPLAVDFAGDTNPGRLLLGSVSDAADLSARVSTAYTDTTLIVAVQVADDFIDAQTSDAAAPLLNDAVELYIDTDRTADDFVPPDRTGNAEGFQIGADTLGNKFTRGAGLTNASWTVSSRTVAGGYVIEFQVPLTMLDALSGPGVVPAGPGSNLRMNMAIVDNDTLVSAQQTYGILWRDGTAAPFGTGESAWVADLVLDDGTPPASSAPLLLTARKVGNVVQGNFIGTDPSGSRDLGNKGDGIEVNNSPGNRIGGVTAGAGNLISGNDGNGVAVVGGASAGTLIQGNRIGTDADGTAALGNAGDGVSLFSGTSATTVGGTGAGAGNLISGNGRVGVWVSGGNNNLIAGNRIGTDLAGSSAIGNGLITALPGVMLDNGTSNNTIGGTTPEARNVISGNKGAGVQILNSSNNNVVLGNNVGTNAAGTAAIPNVQGVYVGASASNNTIGGAANGAGNLISGNIANGVVLISGVAGNVVQGNTIGTDVTGTLDLGNADDGIHVLNAPNNVILGNLISGNNRNGVWLWQSGSTGNRVSGNRIGTNATGTIAVGNSGSGVVVSGGAHNNVVGVNGDGVNDAAEGNVISGNVGDGVFVGDEGTNANVVSGNYIGTTADGTAKLENSVIGIVVASGADDTRIGTDGNGVGDAAERNVISGNHFEGIVVVGATTDRTVIAGNYIGTNAAGLAAVPNGNQGIAVRFGAQDTRIGSDGSNDAFNVAERNIISGNTNYGIVIQTPEWDGTLPAGGVQAQRTVVAGNYIGTNFAGTAKLGNGSGGVIIQLGAQNTRIGTDSNGVADVAERNVISGNTNRGVYVLSPATTGTLIQGNYIGTDATGTMALGNTLSGVSIDNSPGNTVGGSTAAARNVISGNGGWGVAIGNVSGTGNVIAGNYIGTDVTGTVALGNVQYGVWINNKATGNRVGTDGDGVNDAAERNVISGNSGQGVQIQDAGTHGNVVAGNYIGTDASGTADLGNVADGVRISAGATDNTIGLVGAGNLIGGNNGDGIEITGTGTTGNVIAGNRIGVNVAGTAALANSGNGILVSGGASLNLIGTDGNGAGDAAERNIISGNAGHGVYIVGSGVNFNVVAGNFIGVDVTGTKALGNGAGINIDAGAQSNRIGTDSDGQSDEIERNVISGNKGTAIFILRPGTDFNVVAGNYIGLDVTGEAPLGNGNRGILVGLGAKSNRVGTLAGSAHPAAGRNVISANSWMGIQIDSNQNVVAGNYIGTDAAGTVGFGNLLEGIRINGAGTTVGGTAPGTANLIAFNAGIGLLIQNAAATGNTVSRNRIFGNASGNIAVIGGANPTSVTPDLRAVLTGATTRVIGTLAGAPLASYRLELYSSNPAVPEAREFLAEVVVTADAGGTIPLDLVFPIGTVQAGGFTLLATRLDTGETSSLSASVPAALVVVDGTPQNAVPEGTPLTFSTRATDPGPGQTVAYQWRISRDGRVVGEGDEAVFSFTPNDDGAYALTLTVRTSTGQVDSINPVPIAVTNAAPVVTFTSFPETAPPGAPFDVLARVNDPGSADTFTYEWQVWRDGMPVSVPAPSNPLQFAFTPTANGVYEVELAARDDEGLVGSRRVAILVQGQVPEAQIEIQTEGKEGATVHAQAALSAVLAQDQLTFEWTATKNGVLYASSSGVGRPNFEFVPDDNGVYVVSLRLSTPFASFSPPSRSVAVENVIPEAHIGYDTDGNGTPDAAPPTFRAGTAIPFLATVADVGTADVHTFRWTVLNATTGQVVEQGVGPALGFTPPSAGTFVVSVVAEDDDGGRTEVSAAIEVAALARDVQINLPAVPPAEGDLVTLTATVTPPPGDVGLRYVWEVRLDGEIVASADSGTFTTTPQPLMFAPVDDGRYEVRLSVRGEDGSTGEGVGFLDVRNVVPTIFIGTLPSSVPEGATVTVNAAAFDPGTRDTLAYHWTVIVGGNAVATADGPSLTFTPADDGNYTLRVEVHDDDEPLVSGFDVVTLPVLNVAPTVVIRTATDPNGNATYPADEAPFQFHLTSGTFDPGADTLLYSWSVVRVDSSGVSHPLPPANQSPTNRTTFSFSPTGEPGTYVVMLTVDDQEGGVTTQVTRIIAGSDGNDVLTVTPGDLVGGATSVLVVAGGGADVIDASGVTFAVALDGGAGNDTIIGGSGGDLILGGAGTDSLVGGLGNDTLVTQHGDDTVVGGDGDDEYVIVPGSNATLTESVAGGTDLINFSFAERAVTFDLSAAGVLQTVDVNGNQVLFTGSFEAVKGSIYGDRLTAASNTTLFGGDGADQLIVGDATAAVTVFGGDGADILDVLRASNVTVFGGEGDDLVRLASGATAVTVFGGAGADAIEAQAVSAVTVFGGDGADAVSVAASSNVTVYGGAGADAIRVLGGSGIAVFGGDAEGVLTPELDAITVFGGSGDDSIEVQTATNVTVFGGDGLDSISVLSGSAITVFGGDGDDAVTLASPDGLATVFGGDGNDLIDVDAGSAVTVFGGEGDDVVRVQSLAGNSITVFGGAGDDRLDVSAGSAVTVFGGDGNDALTVTGGSAVTVFGEAGDDVLTTRGGSGVTVFGGDGADTIAVAAGNSVTVFGGDGIDAIAVDGGTAVTVFGGEADDAIAVRGGTDVTVFGGAGNDAIALAGTGTNITVFGGDGNDAIRIDAATATGVTVFGEAGDDAIAVTAGNGVTVFGGDGNDAVTVGGLAGRNITVFGGDGNDSVQVSAGTAVTVFGGSGDDALVVTGGTDVTVFGGDGADRIDAAATTGSNITIFGEGGDDTLTVSAGDGVTVFGGDGNDAIDVKGLAGRNITVFGGDGVDAIAVSAGSQVTVFGEGGDDALTVMGGTAVTVFGGDGIDLLAVSGGSNVTVFGGAGDDRLDVSAGTAVTVFGGDGNDVFAITGGIAVTVFGGDGSDVITVAAATGREITVFGGSGDDAVTVSAGDAITVFGGDGNDALTVTGLAGRQITVFGGSGDDAISISAGSQVTVFGEGGDDTVTVATVAGSDITVFGGDGSDAVAVRAGALVTVFGEGGGDVLTSEGDGGTRVNLFGGEGGDTITITAGSQITVFGGTGDDTILVNAQAGSDITVFGGSGDDRLTVTAGKAVTLLGERGNDDLTAADVSDVTLFGGVGNDTLLGTGGIEISLYGDDGDDTYRVLADALRDTRVRVKEIQTLGAGYAPGEKGSSGGLDHVDRPSFGAETLDLSAFNAITLDLNVLGTDLNPLAGWQPLIDLAGHTAVIVLHGFFENVIGTAGNDLITGNQFANNLVGLGGDDTLTGLAGDDTLEGGAGDDNLTGGAGNDTYVFAGTGLGSDTIVEAADRDADTLDFSGLASAVSVDLGSTAPQAQPDGTFALSDGRGLENVIGSAGADAITGNARGNVLEGGAGNDTVTGGAGADTYRFAGENLGTDILAETGTDSDTLDFAALLGGLSLDLASASAQGSADAGTFVALGSPTLFEGVIGTAFPDVIKGNGADNVLIGGGGRDYLDGSAGNDILRGGSGQVIYLDFTSATDPWDWQYDATQQQAIRDNLASDFAPFGYAVTLTPPATGQYLTIVFNDDQTGGRSEGIDFRNTSLAGAATVNVNDLLDDLSASLATAGVSPADIAANWTQYVTALSAHIAGHEAGHSLGLRHGDSYGPIGTGVNSLTQALRYLPGLAPTAVGATETGWHLMSSPASVGTSLADNARDTFLGLREAVKLAHADTGTTLREAAPGYNAHSTFATPVDLGRFVGLTVPNTLQRAADPFFGQSLSVASVAVLGSITGGAGRRSEDDVYAFAAVPGEWFHFEINSFDLGRVANPIDSILRVYDAAGNLVAWNDDEFETPDAVILDWQAAAAGIYYVVVDTYTPDGIRDFDTGEYELFAYRLAAGPDLGLGDTIVTGAGTDTIYTSAAKDVIRLSLGAVRATVVSLSYAPPVVENLVGAEVVALDTAGEPLAVPVKVVNNPPELAPPILPAVMTEGQPIAIAFGATDADLSSGDRLTFRLEAIPGETLPRGASIDAVTGELRWMPTDNGTYRFRVVVSDTSAAEDSLDVTAVVENANPTATLLGPGRLNEGGTANFTVLASDAGVLDALSYAWTIDGVAAGTGPSLSFLPTENRTYTVAVTVTDKDGGAVTASRTLTVANVQPQAAIVSVTGNPVENGTIVVAGTATDAGGPTAITSLSWMVTRGGTVVATGSGTGIAFSPSDNGDYVVTLTVADKDGETATASRTIPVTNLAPVVAALPHLSLGEAQVAAFTGNFTDNAADAPFAFLWRVTGTVGAVPDGLAPTYSFLPPDAGEYEVLFKVTDKDGSSGVTLGRVSVAETAPTATFAQVGTANEGSAATVSFTAASDAPADLAAGLRYSFDLDGDGVYEIVNAASATVNRVFVNDGTYTVRGKVTDKDGAFTVYTATVTVRNVAPTATPTQDGPVAEGGLVAVRLTGPADPSPADTLAGFRYSFARTRDALAATYAAAGAQASQSFAFPDNGTYTVWARVIDQDGGFTDYPVAVTVTNAAPTVGLIAAPTAPTAVGATVGASATFSDPGTADTHTARWDWGDGTTTNGVVTEANGTGSVTGSHAYAKAGVYTVTLTVFDDDVASQQSVFRYVVTYDVDAGSINGSGWFDSPAGAYRPDPTLSGKAHFGFVSRYAKGATVPSGSVSFRLGKFNFSGTAYEWMVIAAPRGMLRGAGTIDGAGDYGFLVSGFDGKDAGSNDLLRIKIWDRSTGAVIYDNQPGAPDDAVPAMAIGAGNVNIHGSNALTGPTTSVRSASVLTDTELNPLVAEALARWRAAGAAVESLAGLPVRIADLPGDTLGLATPGGIWIDVSAAGFGWFVDPTPADDSEFRTPGDQGEQGRLDLLTVLIHEFGHLLGRDHETDGVMQERLDTGERERSESEAGALQRVESPTQVAAALPVRVLSEPSPVLALPTFGIAPWVETASAVPTPPTSAAEPKPRAEAGIDPTPLMPASRKADDKPVTPDDAGPDEADRPGDWWGVPLDTED